MRNLNGIKFLYQDEELIFKIERYAFNKARAKAVTNNGEQFTHLTINIPSTSLKEDEILVKTWSENKNISDFLRNSEFFENTGVKVKTGFVEAEIWKIK